MFTLMWPHLLKSLSLSWSLYSNPGPCPGPWEWSPCPGPVPWHPSPGPGPWWKVLVNITVRDNPGESVPEPSETLTQYTTFVLKFLTSTPPSLSSQASQSTSTHGRRWKKHEKPEDKNLHFLHTRLILYFMSSLPQIRLQSCGNSFRKTARKLRSISVLNI